MRTLRLFILLQLLLLIIPTAAFANSRLIGQLPATETAWVAHAAPTMNYSGTDALTYTIDYVPINNGPIPVYCPQVTRQVFLKFDLSQIDFAIDKARVRVRPIGIIPTPPVSIQLLAAEDTWSASNINWVNTPAVVGVPHQGPAEISPTGDIYWSDTGDIAAIELAEWLETQRAENGGDNTATFAFSTMLIPACWPQPPSDIPLLNVQFFDTGSAHPPLLEVASADEELPLLLDVTAIQMDEASAEAPPPLLPIVGVTVLATLTLVALAYSIRHQFGRVLAQQ